MGVTTVKMDAPVGETRLDRSVQGVVGRPLDRYEGPLKVTGTAPYAYEFDAVAEGAGQRAAFGFMVQAAIGKGRVTAIHREAAAGLPGVLHILVDWARTPRFAADSSEPKPQQGAVEVTHWGQPLALVVAETYEQARAAAQAVTVDYAPAADGRYDTEAAAPGAAPATPTSMFSPRHDVGDLDRAIARAAHVVDATYRTPGQIHCAMEPHASLAIWAGEEVTVYGSFQMPATNRRQLARALGIPAARVRLVSRYVGGGFGSKLGIGPDAVLAALAALAIGRPVKVALTRQQLFGATSRRTETVQRVRLAADAGGRLTGIGHDSTMFNAPDESFWEPCGLATETLYAAANRRITHSLATVDLMLSASMRAPGEAVGMLALENAMDEMAERLGMDPVAFRKLNEPERDPLEHRPFSSRHLVECLDEGARRFGWDRRRATPGQAREGEWLVGMGVAAAARNNLLQQSSALVRLLPSGDAVVETDMTDIGTGSYSILNQIAAELLGLPTDRVEVRLGDTRFPPSAGSGGSWGAASAGSSVAIACEALVGRLAGRIGVAVDDMTLKDGMAIAANRQVPLADLLAGETWEETGTIQPGRNDGDHTQVSYGAHFAEVAVSRVTGEARVRRMLGVFAAGRILNPKTARSQCLGGMVFGIGAALTEELRTDTRHGLFVNHDLAEYHLPVNADVPQMDVHFLDERDDVANPLKVKGIGELGISGAGAAITNAIYNACGVRVRDYPLTLDKIMAAMPEALAA